MRRGEGGKWIVQSPGKGSEFEVRKDRCTPIPQEGWVGPSWFNSIIRAILPRSHSINQNCAGPSATPKCGVILWLPMGGWTVEMLLLNCNSDFRAGEGEFSLLSNIFLLGARASGENRRQKKNTALGVGGE